MTIFSGTEATSPELRPLTDQEKNILYMLTELYTSDRARAAVRGGLSSNPDAIIEAANAVMQVEGLLDRIIRTGLVSPVLSTLERCAS
jgi:hypothetical protein